MEKLELKHLAAYLPYKLKGNAINNEYFEPVLNGELVRICTDGFILVDETECTIEDFKPILRPLTDLNKEIVVNGEEFVPFEKMGLKRPLWDITAVKELLQTGYLEQKYFEMLVSWHFDVYNLIEKGLAVDMNLIYNK